MHQQDIRFMQAALSMARRNLGQTWPNPSVGAVLVKNGQAIAHGWTARSGRPHAETEVIATAGDAARGATLYVTLEPCSHHGKTGPCTDAIIQSGISRCVIACGDPNPQVNGQGIAQLKNAGIEVIENIAVAEARALNRGFFSVIQKKRPLVSLKIATSLDGKITTGNTAKRWLTSERARDYGHMLRSRHDAILTGIGTALADDPELTCRLAGLEDRSPVRILIDSDMQLPLDSQLIATVKKSPIWLIPSPLSRRRSGFMSEESLKEAGVRIIYPEKDVDPGLRRDDNVDLNEALELLAEQGITRLLVEAGQKLTTAFLQNGLVDRLYWFRAPIHIGDAGLSATSSGTNDISALAPMRQVRQIALPPDQLDIFESCSPAS